MTKEAISTERALRLALEALEYIRNFETEVTSQTKYGNAAQVIEEALASEAIEQSAPATELREQEPVAWMYDWICEGKRIEGWIAHKESEIPRLLASNIRPLYTTPQPAQPQPVGYVAENGVVDWNVCAPPIMTDLYTSPPTLSLAQPGREVLEAAHTRLQKKYGELEGKVRRTWVELTDEDIDLFINGRGDEDDEDYVEPTGDGFGLTDDDLVILVRRAEAKLKEKNQ